MSTNNNYIVGATTAVVSGEREEKAVFVKKNMSLDVDSYDSDSVEGDKIYEQIGDAVIWSSSPP